MTTLHILNASPLQSAQFNSCFRVLADDDGIVLCGEAVQLLRKDSSALRQLLNSDDSYRLYALREDVQARGIDTKRMPVTMLEYSDFVALCVDYTRVNSWT